MTILRQWWPWPLGLACTALACTSTQEPGAGSGGSANGAAGSDSGAGGHGGIGSAAGGQDLPHEFTVTGTVTDGESLVEGAIVMQAGGTKHLVTGADGVFSILLTQEIPGIPTLVAAKQGYRTRGEEFRELPSGPVELRLRFVTQTDNTDYAFGIPGVGDPTNDNSTAFCGHCHTTFTKQWRGSAHSRAAKTIQVQDVYAGTALALLSERDCVSQGGQWRSGLQPGSPAIATNKCYLGGGVLPSLNPGCDSTSTCDAPSHPSPPTNFGECANCHAPGMDGPLGGRSLHEASGISYDAGVHCDFCHKISDVDLAEPAGVGGRLRILRPIDRLKKDDLSSPLLQVMFGPLPDVPNVFMGGSLQPKFKSAELCAGCHEYRQAALVPGTTLAPRFASGLPVHSTYSEWQESSFAQSNVVCQDCHMPPDDTGLVGLLDVTTPQNADTAFGFVRPPDQIRQHTFRGPLHGEPRFIEKALTLSVSTAIAGALLVVTPEVKNVAAGHAIPTGEPMRALALVIIADGCGERLVQTSGPMLPIDAGVFASTKATAPLSGLSIMWPGASASWVGKVLVARRSTGTFDDYDGQGIFALAAGLPAAEKGAPNYSIVAITGIAASGANQIGLESAVDIAANDELLVVDVPPSQLSDGAPALAHAGAPGWWFARSTVDSNGATQPHYRATDIAFDTRLGPGQTWSRAFGFALPPSCAQVSIRAELLYRQFSWKEGRARQWGVVDHVVHSQTNVVNP